MYLSIDIPMYLLTRLQRKPEHFKLYIKLLNDFYPCFIDDSLLIPSISINTYEDDCRYYGYKSKSGFWKALNKLKTMGLIEIVNKKIYFPYLKINCR